MNYFWIAGFGILGVLSRYFVDRRLAGLYAPFPSATFAINIVGSLLAGVFLVLASEKGIISQPVFLGLFVGFCGGFTTFSAFSIQALALFETGNVGMGLLYLFGSPAVGVGAAFVGVHLARSLI